MKHLYSFILIVSFFASYSQTVSLAPTVSPSLFRAQDEITVTYDVTGTALASLTNAYIWVWSPDPTINGKYNINPASNNASTSNAKFTKSEVNGKTLFTITFVPADFFTEDLSSRPKIGMLLKGNDWSNGQTTDFITTFWDGASYELKVSSPATQFVAIAAGAALEIQAEVPTASTFRLYDNDVLIDEQSSITSYNYSFTASISGGYGTLTLSATDGAASSEKEISYFVLLNSDFAARPPGIIPGINYSSDETKATLCLWAPGKNSVYVRGDFTAWQLSSDYLMKRDGEFFWLELTGLASGTEYAFQYFLEGSVFIADPYSDKILDPDDENIPDAIYPDLKNFPAEARSDTWYLNRASVVQTGQAPYTWQTTNFQKPAKENLVIYELLVRDFFDADHRSYQSLIDTIHYFKRLGVNAIELMPVMEFNGNESWGYNPTFMFAPDKAYGPKSKLKEFIDKCHGQGIAVILDIAMNHHDMPNPYVLMDFDFASGRPTTSNKWFNVQARHPFNVFFDMNHESPYTKAYLDSVNHYWLNEFKVDGFRFDLSKGFTQNDRCNGSTENSNCFGQRDDSRIAILKRMADKIWSHTNDAIIILEHFADNSEEKELAEYRLAEGKGMMLWGNMNHAYNQLTMGYVQDSDISWSSHQHRGWASPHVVAYMESHDEDRLNYRNQKYGNTFQGYSAKDPSISLARIKAASVVFYTIPGPKMVWQFGELGYDYSINTCPDLSESDQCRVSPKPVKWEYYEEADRFGLWLHTADLIKMHCKYSVFNKGIVSITKDSLITDIQLKNSPYTSTPASSDEMNVQAIANFHLRSKSVAINFPHTGTWYDYYKGGEGITVTSVPYSITLGAGEYKLFTDVPIESGPVTAIEEFEPSVSLYPNPSQGKFRSADGVIIRKIIDSRGVEVAFRIDDQYVDISHLPPGLYIVYQTNMNGRKGFAKIIKN